MSLRSCLLYSLQPDIIPASIRTNESHSRSNDNGEDGEDNEEQPLDIPELEAADLYIHIILLDKGFIKKQVPVRVTSFSTDYDIFIELNRVYRQHRGSWRPLTALKGLRLTKVYAI
jgi:hypothetical protein